MSVGTLVGTLEVPSCVTSYLDLCVTLCKEGAPASMVYSILAFWVHGLCDDGKAFCKLLVERCVKAGFRGREMAGGDTCVWKAGGQVGLRGKARTHKRKWSEGYWSVITTIVHMCHCW